MTPPHGLCQDCRQWFRLRPNGTVRWHKRQLRSAFMTCRGWAYPPAEIS